MGYSYVLFFITGDRRANSMLAVTSDVQIFTQILPTTRCGVFCIYFGSLFVSMVLFGRRRAGSGTVRQDKPEGHLSTERKWFPVPASVFVPAGRC